MMAIAKPDQGKIVRRTAFVLLLAFSIFTYFKLGEVFAGYENAFGKVLYKSFTVAYAISAVIALVLLVISYRLTMSKPNSVDFLIDVETELRKVAWPINVEAKNIWDKTEQLRTSSIVVFCVMLFMALSLAAYDYLFGELFQLFIRMYS